jgi:hypothetical protein
MYEPPDAFTYSRTVQDFFIPAFTRHIGSAAVQLDHELQTNLTLTSLTSYFTSYNRGYTDFYKQPVPIDLLQQNADNRVYSEELRLASSGASDLDWLVGAFFQGHKNEVLSIDNNYNADPNNPMLVPLTPNPAPTRARPPWTTTGAKRCSGNTPCSATSRFITATGSTKPACEESTTRVRCRP